MQTRLLSISKKLFGNLDWNHKGEKKMALQITELTFLQVLASRFHLPTPEYLTAEAGGAEIRDAINKWGGKAMVKPDVLSGKRGKAGLVQLVTNYVEAQHNLKYVQSMKVNGQLPRTAYLVQYIPSDADIYTAITYDSRYLGPAMTISFHGGIDVEDIEDDKKAIFPIDIYKGLGAYQASEVLYKLDCPQEFVSPFSRVLVDLWDMFISTGMRMCEVNPWRITPKGQLYACDFKAVFDESNFKFKNLGFDLPEYPANQTPEEEHLLSSPKHSFKMVVAPSSCPISGATLHTNECSELQRYALTIILRRQALS
jgi:succinyl-CoA synthetase beta subunit